MLALAWVYLLVGPPPPLVIAKVLSDMLYYGVRACLFVWTLLVTHDT